MQVPDTMIWNSAGAIQLHPYYTLLYFSDFETPNDPMIVVMAGKTAGEQPKYKDEQNNQL